MKVQIEETSSVERKLNIEVPWERFQEEIERTLVRIRKSASLKGFRKGKAPMEMVRRIYSEDARKDAVDIIARETVMGTLQENELKPFGNPYLTDVQAEDNEPLRMEAMVELEPTFELADYGKMELEKPVMDVTDYEIDDFLKNMQERNAEVSPVEDDGVLKDDNIATLDFTGTRDGKLVDELDVKDFLVRIGTSELFPGFEEQIVGMKTGETKEFDILFPDDFRNEDLAGDSIHFAVTVKSIRELKLPELDEEFARTVGEYEDMKALREAIKKDIQEHKDSEAVKILKNNLTRNLVEANYFEVPPSLADRELQNIIQQYGENMMRAGLPNDKIKEMIIENEGDLKKSAHEHVRLAYIVTEIAEREGFEADDAEVENIVNGMAMQTGKSKDELMEQYQSDGTINDIAFNLIRDQIYDMILETAKVKEVKPKVAEPVKKAGKSKKKTTKKK